VLAIIGAGGVGGTIGLYGGGLADQSRGKNITGHIGTGLASMVLSSKLKLAACVTSSLNSPLGSCHPDNHVSQGSDTVRIGREFRPMSRLGDGTDCGGIIAEGVASILVGGPVTGLTSTEQTSPLLRDFTVLVDLASLLGGFDKLSETDTLLKLAMRIIAATHNTGQLVVDATGYHTPGLDLALAVSALVPAMPPSNAVDMASIYGYAAALGTTVGTMVKDK
jgi:hypothetical protein